VSDPARVFERTPDGLAERLGGHLRTHRPVVAGGAVVIAGYVVMAALVIGLGLIITKWLAGGPVGTWEDSVNRWFVEQRTTTLDSVSRAGSDLGATLTIIGIAVVAGIVLAIGRHRRELGFLVAALTLEASVSLTSSLVINRARPNVRRLDAAPPTSSLPSGHTAAAIVLFVSLAILITSYVRNTTVRIFVWIVAAAIPIYVGISRLYRGMHHPTDEMGSAVLVAGALLVALLACRTAGAVLHDRTTKTERAAP
jgi:membrane-associated phospholipid phosphatase